MIAVSATARLCSTAEAKCEKEAPGACAGGRSTSWRRFAKCSEVFALLPLSANFEGSLSKHAGRGPAHLWIVDRVDMLGPAL